MTRLTQHELSLIDAARTRGPHPEQPGIQISEISAAELRRRAEAERAQVIAAGLQQLRSWLASQITRYAPALVRKRIEIETRRELMNLDDALLRDIGIPRCEVATRARLHAESVIPRRT